MVWYRAAMAASPLDEQLTMIYLAFRSTLLQAPRGGLVLLAEQSPQAPLHAAGVRIAGESVLLVVADAGTAKQAVRAGWSDFMVNTLDEALRILKLALRRRSATGVVLCAAPGAVLAECAERGVQPALLDVDAAPLLGRGTQRVQWQRALTGDEQWERWGGRSVSAAALEQADAIARACILAQREEKLAWLERAPRALGRAHARERLLPMTAEEGAAFRALLAADAGTGSIELMPPL